ncbi:substrate-binding periplasmic protein [Piscirickettsia litoralis]|uniref:Solute-binding protein family 3/N-terminal domain-containing protein n=1 Tax=Piscirickettsia litoralis TaxID=1891921 RepID=A0ABX3A2K1_9GAMM|nr:transporter substrate-binding domain-containing protein [Piscirickettsia litoralis]ODN43092.1 hypothetical protein BGC07_09405 [Piscirickettsia litoralis]
MMKSLKSLIMVYIFINLAIIFNLICSSTIQAKLLNFTTGQFPPYSTGSTDNPQGPMHDVILATCTQMRQDCFFHFVPWNFSVIMTQNNQATGIFPMVKNASSKNWLKFSKPIIKSEFGFFIRKQSINTRSYHALKKFHLATTGPGELMRQLVILSKEIPNSTLYIDQNIENSFKRFNQNNFKNYAVLADRATGEHLIKVLKLKDIHYAFKVDNIEYGVGFPKKSVKAAMIGQFNASLTTVLNDQEFTKQVENKYGVLLARKK